MDLALLVSSGPPAPGSFTVLPWLVAVIVSPQMIAQAGSSPTTPMTAMTAATTPAAIGPFDLRGANFRGVDLRTANLAGRDLTGCSFQNADLTDTVFWRARLDKVDFRGARGLTAGQLASAHWRHDKAPRLGDALNRFCKFWERRRAAQADLRKAVLWSADLHRFDCTGANLQGAILINANLRSAVLLRAQLDGAILAGADLTGADLRGARGLTAAQLLSARWDRADPPRVGDALNLMLRFFDQKQLVGRSLRGLRLWRRDLRKMNFTGTDLSGGIFIGADLRGATLREADLTDAVLTGADLSGADLRGARGLTIPGLLSARWQVRQPPGLDQNLALSRARFDRGNLAGSRLAAANLSHADLAGASLEGASLRDTVLAFANLRGTTLVDADLSGAVLTGADLSSADLRTARGLTAGQLLSARWQPGQPPRLSRALTFYRKLWAARDLQGNGLQNADLWDVGLAGAKLHGGDLSGVQFVRANLRGANFRSADLRGVGFQGSDLTGADLRGVRNLRLKSILAAVWDPAKPPTLDIGFNYARALFQNRRIEFGLAGAQLQKADPVGVMGPLRPTDRFAMWSLAEPPYSGLARLIQLLRQADYRQLWIAAKRQR